MQQAVNLEKTVPIEQNLVALDRQKTPILQPLQRRPKSLFYIHAEFILEVMRTDVAQFKLQNKFANQALIVSRGQCSRNGKLVCLDPADIGVKIVVVLIVSAADVTERSDTE